LSASCDPFGFTVIRTKAFCKGEREAHNIYPQMTLMNTDNRAELKEREKWRGVKFRNLEKMRIWTKFPKKMMKKHLQGQNMTLYVW
jgi:hypothetical protein